MREVEITSIHQVTPGVKQFELADDEPFDYEPGQHTQLHFDASEASEVDTSGDDDEVVRPYTPTTLPGTDRLVLAIKRYDDGTASVYMHEQDPGNTIRIEKPDGNLYLRNLDSDVAFVSTGTGITPMMAMVKHYLRDGDGHATFLYGEKTQDDVMYRETLDQLEAENENLTVAYSLSDEEWDGRTGHVQEHVESVVPDPESTDFYCCGVPGMVVETKAELEEIGVPEERIYSEGWEEDEVSDE
ncbi:FAD-binding oxidoreductase [Haladaptatus sp. AB618]|uniref:ferredoxin--NADP reductase n=1 Tax=Haladaptatus sp. AB618 TaxID=2934173 RepID=UPI00209BF787|nr:FAD-binding oxidoreductase [Haladaptatus sp. AB618]MCO8255243.1 FAD-binding oxidoreductase [Haladaptatus sp. AB618]